MGSVRVRVRVWMLCAAALVGVYLCSSGLLRLNEVFTQVAPASSPPSISATTTKSDADDAPRAAAHKRYDRLVVVLIDALRADMVLGSDVMYGRQPAAAGDGGALSVRDDELNAHMPYTRALVASGDALGYIGHASVPTVTMPRLKALVTGKAPAFIDILKNFNSAALSEENLVELLAENGHRIVFYGDDTWLKLFPSAFERSDGTSGFFTRDTVEVDDNVTRHLQDELDPTMQNAKSLDWDVLVLHYLGLDHVGHLRGPRSPMMVDKLHEMDEIVERVHESVKAQDTLRLAQNPSALPSLVLLCSDHGMSEVGNHGGATVEESSALMLFLRGDGKKMRSSKSEKYTQRRKQVDLVPTIASLFRLRIPPYNTGLLLDEVIQAADADGMSTTSTTSSQYLRALYQNFQQLYGLAVIKFHKASFVNFDASYGATVEKIRVYLENSTEDQEVDTEFDVDLVVKIREACGVLQDKLAQSDGSEYNAGMVLVGLCLLFCSAEVAVRMLWRSSSLNHATPFKSDPVTIVLVLGSVLQVVSLTSSSSIENEHATSFYLLTTVLCAFGFKIVSSSSSNISKAKSAQWSSMVLLALVLITTRMLRSRNQVINFGRLNGIKLDMQQYGNEFATDDSLSILSTGPLFNGTIPSEAFFVLICGLVGSKALLLYTKKAVARHPLALLGLSLSSLSFSIGILCSLLCSRMARLESQDSEHQEQEDHSSNNTSSNFILQVMAQPSADDYARIVYASVAFLVAQLTVNRVARLLVAEMVVWLLVTLLQRESNLPTLGCLCVQLFCLSLLLKNQRNRKYQDLSNGVALGLLGLWLAQSAFFALGNSHLVTTIDISQSFHGLSGYTQWIVGLLTFVSVFSGPLVVFVNLLQWVHNVAILDHHSGDGKDDDDDDDASVSISAATNGSSTVHDVCLALFAYQTLRFAVYTIVVYFMRFHLFIWSVFAPKVDNRLTSYTRSLPRFTFSQMLYEVAQTSVVLVLVVIVSTLPHGTEIDRKPKRT